MSRRVKTPVDFARAECANWHSGICLLKFDTCRLASGEPCAYFEACVLAVASEPVRRAYLCAHGSRVQLELFEEAVA